MCLKIWIYIKCIPKKSILKIISTTIKVIYNYQGNLIKAKILETKNILIDEKNFNDLTVCFTRYDYGKLIKMLSLYYELVGKIKEHDGKKVNNW